MAVSQKVLGKFRVPTTANCYSFQVNFHIFSCLLHFLIILDHEPFLRGVVIPHVMRSGRSQTAYVLLQEHGLRAKATRGLSVHSN